MKNFISLQSFGLVAAFTMQGQANVRPMAIVENREGDTRIRREGATSWHYFSENVSLFVGDRLFVGNSGKIVFRYLQEGNLTVAMGPGNIFEIASESPISSKLLKGFDGGNGQVISKDFITGQGKSFLANAKKGGVESKDLPIKHSSIELQVAAKKARILFPIGSLFIAPQAFPAKVSILVEKNNLEEIFLGTLYRIRPEPLEPQWSGRAKIIKSSGNKSEILQFDIPMTKAGFYVFQATSNQGFTQTDPVSLQVAEPASEILPSTLKPNDSVVLP